MRPRLPPTLVVLSLVAATALAACASPGRPDTSEEFWPLGRRIVAPDRIETRLGPLARVVETTGTTTVDVLHPIFRSHREPHRDQVDVRPFLHSIEIRRDDGTVARDWAFLPFLYGGDGPEDGSHFLFFPFGGNVKGILGREEMTFALFPLYVGVESRGYESTHLLWPLVSWGSGQGRDDLRIMPFYAHEEIEGVRRYESRLWPFLHWGVDGLNTDHPTETFFLFPVYGQRDSDVSWNRTVLFPIFHFAGNEDGYRNTEVWPFFRRTETPEGRDLLRIWPLFQHDDNGERRSDYYLWPLIWSEDDRLPTGDTQSLRAIPFLYRMRFHDLDGQLTEATDQLWPLFRDRRYGDGSRRFQMLAPVPFRGWDAFEGSYGFLWSLLDHEHAADGSTDTSLLFGLIRYRTTPRDTYAGLSLLLEYASDADDAKFHILKGLAGYETGEQGRAIRLLWGLRIPF